ncbi:MAG: TatD family hydrolase [Planctomycetota bacterium]|jgi:predicted metal-dependent TIM-barrel fold hydrolase
MNLFDPHIHMYARVTDDYERMQLSGIRATIEPAFWLGEPRKHAGTFFDYFSHLLNFEASRAAQFGIQLFAAIAMNPREANNRALSDEVIGGIEEFLDHPRCVAVGEIGYDDNTGAEDQAVRRQLGLATAKGLPVIVHTPHRHKKQGVERLIAVLNEMDYDMDRVVIDHSTEETTRMILDSGAWAGHTVYPVTKLSPARFANIVAECGTDRMLVNSSADWGISDPLSVPKVVQELRGRGYSDAEVSTVVWDNPIALFSRSGRLDPLLEAVGAETASASS